MTQPSQPLPRRSDRSTSGRTTPGRGLRLVGPRSTDPGDTASPRSPDPAGRVDDAAARAVIGRLMAVRGARSAGVLSDRMSVASVDDPRADDAAAVLRWAGTAVGVLGGTGGGDVEDLLITTATSYHIIRTTGRVACVVHLELHRDRSNLAAARQEVAAAARSIVVEAVPPAAATPIGSTSGAPAPADTAGAPGSTDVHPAPVRGPDTAETRQPRATPTWLTLTVGDVLRYRRRRA